LPLVSLLTFISSWAALYPAGATERWYARGLYPKLSHLAGRFADSVPFAWLDLAIIAAVVGLVLIFRKRKWLWLVNVLAGLYLLFFWTWGLNYHRRLLATKLELDPARMETAAMAEFAKRAALEVNRLYDEKQGRPYDETATRAEAVRRVRKVIAIIDGSDWQSAERIKVSWIGGVWLRAAGIDGVFNPIAHEPIINNTLLDVDRPFVMAHELAHVRGYPEEGDANVIATFATLMSDDPAFRYSGWLNLWLYLQTRELVKLLNAGPRNDIDRMIQRARAEQIRWISDFQVILLDLFLKANNVEGGVRSYSRVALTAAGTEPIWERFR
jgi:hypothetical protein